jgi:hypothetical protein
MRLAILVFVVAKNTRALLSIASGLPFRAGIAITGAKQAAEKPNSLKGTAFRPSVSD